MTKAELEKENKELKIKNSEYLNVALNKTISLGLSIVTNEDQKQLFKNYYEMNTRDLQEIQKEIIIEELENIIIDYFEY